MPDAPLLLCYDGSEDAKHAIENAARLFSPRPGLVLAVWQGAAALPPFAWGGVPDLQQVYDAVRDQAADTADEGVRLAERAGLAASPLVVEALGAVWALIVEMADQHDVAAVVMGSRGRSGIRSVLLGSVSTGVVHHANRPTFIVRRADS